MRGQGWLFPTLAIAGASVGVAVVSTYCSYVLAVAVFLIVIVGVLFFSKPDWFLYLLAFSKVNLEALTLATSRDPRIAIQTAIGADGIIALFLMFFSWIYFLGKGKKVVSLPAVKAYALFLVISGIGLVLSPEKYAGVRSFVKYSNYFIVYLLVAVLLDSREKTLRLVKAVCLSCIIPLAVGLYQAVTGTGDVSRLGFNRIFSVVGFATHYSVYLLTVLLICATMYMYFSSVSMRSFLIILIALLLISFVLTYTRGGWISFAFALFVFSALLAPRGLFSKNLFYLFLTLVIVVVLVAAVSLPTILERLEDVSLEYNTLYYRFDTMRVYAEEFFRSPLVGHGLGSYWHVAKKHHFLTTNVHNNYILVMFETGIFGLIAYVLAMASLFIFAVKRYRSCREPGHTVIASGFLALMCGLLLNQMSDDLLLIESAYTYFWFFAGIAYNLLKESGQQ